MNSVLSILGAIVAITAAILSAVNFTFALRSYRRLAASEKEIQQDMQRQSFVYGNTVMANDKITRETVNQAADKLRNKSLR
jgi:hypothetical protein